MSGITLSPERLRAARANSVRRLWAILALVTAAGLIALPRPAEEHAGASGRSYTVFRVSERWAPAGEAVVVRYRSHAASRVAAAEEAADLLPAATAQAEAAGLRRIVLQANAPVVRVGRGARVYREWRFRYVERAGEWLPEDAVPTRF